MGEIRDLQKRVYANKVSHGFNVTNVEMEFCLMMTEIGEAYEAIIKKGKDDVADELADIGIYLLGLAEILGVDLEDAIMKKAARNEKRVYKIMENGHAREVVDEQEGLK